MTVIAFPGHAGGERRLKHGCSIAHIESGVAR